MLQSDDLHVCKNNFYGYDNNDNDYQNHTEKHGATKKRICNARHKALKDMSGVLHNGSYCDYYFIVKVLTEMFGGQFEFL